MTLAEWLVPTTALALMTGVGGFVGVLVRARIDLRKSRVEKRAEDLKARIDERAEDRAETRAPVEVSNIIAMGAEQAVQSLAVALAQADQRIANQDRRIEKLEQDLEARDVQLEARDAQIEEMKREHARRIDELERVHVATLARLARLQARVEGEA